MPSVGRNIPHDSAEGHVSGRSLYVDDLAPLRNELIVDFYWSPIAHGTIVNVDLSAASAVPGVVGLFTHRDLDGSNLFGPILQDELLLAEDEVMFVGQPIVVIAAESREAIRQAKAALVVEIEELPTILTIEEAIHEQQFIGAPQNIRRGDVDKALAEADHILEGTFTVGGQDHFYLESQAAIAYPGEQNMITVHSSTQNPSEVQDVIAHLLGLQQNQVVCINKRMGGAFGGKECQATHPAAIVALVAHKTKRPARIAYTKDDDMCVTGKRHPFRNEYRVGFRNDGTLTALDVAIYSNGGAFADLSTAVLGRAMTHIDNAYWIPNVRAIGRVCRTNLPPNTALRGFGGPQAVSTMENIIEEMALTLDRDPLEIRQRNCYGTGERNVTPYGQILENNNLPRLFEELTVRSKYHRRRQDVVDFNRRSKTHLQGIALTPVKFGISFNTRFLNQANALVNVYRDGTVQVSTGATEMGQGVNTKIRQFVADELGIAADQVTVMITSTEKNHNTSATAASSSADLNGKAAVDACQRIRERMAVCAAIHLGEGAAPGQIVFERGQVYDRSRPDHRLSFPDLVMLAYRERISLGERGFYATPGIHWDPVKGTGSPFLYFTQGCAVSQVQIDRFTGELKVLQSDVLMDIGRPVNPGIDRGQMTGGFIQGMGWVTTEELKYSDRGELLSHSPTTYKIPNIQDVPEVFHVDYLEIENPVNIHGSKAVGEPPLLMAISIWAAVKHALGFLGQGRIPRLDLPATNEEILMRMTELTRSAVPAGE